MVSYCRQYISFYGHIIYRSTVVKWLKCWYDMVPTWNTLIMLFVMPSIGRFTIAAAKFLCFCWIVEPRWFILFLYLYLHFLKALYFVTLLTDLLPKSVFGYLLDRSISWVFQVLSKTKTFLESFGPKPKTSQKFKCMSF